MSEPEQKTIDHIPGETRPKHPARLWWAAWGFVVFGWVTYLIDNDPAWHPIALGAFTGLVLASWAVDITGNKFPRL